MLVWPALIVAATLFVAYANGANDNFKGVATLFGSGTADYRKALWWATATTLLGSLTALLLSLKLVDIFQGKGLVPPAHAASEPFVLSVVLGAALTIFLASKTAIPISTTHSLTGALIGSGLVAAGSELSLAFLGKSFFAPLLISPLASVVLVVAAYPVFRFAVARLGVTRETCICVGQEWVPVAAFTQGPAAASRVGGLRVLVDEQAQCAQRYNGTIFGVNAQSMLDGCHYLSAGAVSFARGLNDTPKIVALGLSFGSLGLLGSVGLVALAMAAGGLIDARRVAETVSRKITAMDHGEGFTANLITSLLVIGASRWGLPVSTTHVSCGALFGIGIARGQARWVVIRTILLAWVMTLPFAGVSAAAIYVALSRLG